MNLAANKAGKAPAKLMLKLGTTASDVRKLRDLFNWEDATKTLGFLLVNLVAVVFTFLFTNTVLCDARGRGHVLRAVGEVQGYRKNSVARLLCLRLSKRYVHLRRLKKGYAEPLRRP